MRNNKASNWICIWWLLSYHPIYIIISKWNYRTIAYFGNSTKHNHNKTKILLLFKRVFSWRRKILANNNIILQTCYRINNFLCRTLKTNNNNEIYTKQLFNSPFCRTKKHQIPHEFVSTEYRQFYPLFSNSNIFYYLNHVNMIQTYQSHFSNCYNS